MWSNSNRQQASNTAQSHHPCMLDSCCWCLELRHAVRGAGHLTWSLSLCCLSCTVQGKVRWAMAGRNKAKLEEIKQQLAQYDPDIQVCCCRGWGVGGLHPDPPTRQVPHSTGQQQVLLLSLVDTLHC